MYQFVGILVIGRHLLLLIGLFFVLIVAQLSFARARAVAVMTIAYVKKKREIQRLSLKPFNMIPVELTEKRGKFLVLVPSPVYDTNTSFSAYSLAIRDMAKFLRCGAVKGVFPRIRRGLH